MLHHLPNGAEEAERIELEEIHTFTEQLAHFAKCLDGEAEPVHSVRDSRAVLELISRAHADAAGWEQSISPLTTITLPITSLLMMCFSASGVRESGTRCEMWG